MTWELAGRAILTRWPGRGQAIVMLAIGAAESGQFTSLHGDPASSYPQYTQYACNGYLSHGFLQIFMGAHYQKLVEHTGSSDPCVWSSYLENFYNCADVGWQVWYDRGGGTDYGYTAWSVFNNGSYLAYIAQATGVIDSLLYQPPSPPPPPPPPEPTPPPAEVIGLEALIFGGTLVMAMFMILSSKKMKLMAKRL